MGFLALLIQLLDILYMYIVLIEVAQCGFPMWIWTLESSRVELSQLRYRFTN